MTPTTIAATIARTIKLPCVRLEAVDGAMATADMRRLVYELRPLMLDELGLVGAIRNFKLGDSPLQLEVIAPESMPGLSAVVEMAV